MGRSYLRAFAQHRPGQARQFLGQHLPQRPGHGSNGRKYAWEVDDGVVLKRDDGGGGGVVG